MNMDIKQELDRRIKKGVKEIVISPLFEKDKTYNIDRRSDNYEKEDKNGHLVPEFNHCWITWKSKNIDCEGNVYWCNEAYSFSTLEEASEAKKYLEKHLI
jgi:hypothetical protein